MLHLTRRRARLAAALVAVGLVVAACGDDNGESEAEAGAETSAPTTTAEAGVEVTGAWARTTAEGQAAGAVYLTITRGVDDAVVGASVPAEVAGRVELHETVAAEDAPEGVDGGMDDTSTTAGEGGGMDSDQGSMDGSMTMVPIDAIELPAGEAVSLEPGGIHVMLLDLPGPLVAGDTFTVTLELESGDDVDVDIEVSDQAP